MTLATDSLRRVWPLALLALTLLGSGRADAAPGRWKRYAELLGRADSLQRAGASGAAFALLDSLGAAADAQRNADLRVVATLGRARALLNAGRSRDAEPVVRALLPELEAQRDTVGLCRALRYLARIDDFQGRAAEARAGYERCLTLAQHAGAGAEAGWALMALGSSDLAAGRAAEATARLRRAVATLERASEPRAALNARAELARSLQTERRTDEARSQHARVLDEARRLGDRALEAQTLANLGSLELAAGEPGLAAPRLREALERFQRMGFTERALWASNALSIVYVNLGRHDEAESVLVRALPDAERSRDLDTRARVLCQMGVVRREQGRLAEAVEYGRRALALADSIAPVTGLDVLFPLHATLERAARDGEALGLIEDYSAKRADRLAPAQRGRIEVARAGTLRRLGRPAEALALLRPVLERDWAVVPPANAGAQRLSDLADLARCYRDAGVMDSSLAWFGRIAGLWESWRATTSDPGWREKYDDFARRFSGDYAAALLDPRRGGDPDARARAAFDALQRFRARTLLERIRDPAAGPAPAPGVIDAQSLQQRVLRPGELFVDLHALPETTLVLALSRGAIRAYGLPAARSLVPRLERLSALVADPSSGGSALLASASTSLGAELLGPAADLAARSTRIVFAAGTLVRLALDQLILPGEHEPLVLGREVTWVPSARLLADARDTRPGRAARALLAIAQSTPYAGVGLPGARREAQWLAREFVAADVLADASVPSAATVTARAGGYQVLHVAAHTRPGGRRPWQDALRVGTSAREDAWLTAAQIARLELPARLCVIAGCGTIGGGPASGETLEGLSTAWLAAGARTVIATRWPVDDEATAELMRRFYGHLSAGQTAGTALRAAQLELRSRPDYTHPYYWAGVLLIGEPETRVTLVPRAGRSRRVTGRL